MPNVYNNILDAIGNTPMVRLSRLPCSQSAEVLLKLEYFNAGGSTKDRIALGMIYDFQRRGLLKAGMTIVESSSGNTAIGLAIASVIYGYNLVAICDRHLPMGKRLRLRAYGATIVFLPETPEGLDTVQPRIEMANYLAAKLPNAVTLQQFDNLENRHTHYATTGQEIWRDTEGRLDACVVAVGTCGSVSGIGRALKEKNSGIEIYGVEPEGSIIFGGEPGKYLVQGGGLSFIPGNLDRGVIDRGFKVSDQKAFDTARRLAQEEGIMIGGTSAIAVYVALEIAKDLGPGKRVVAVIPDHGERYLDSVYSDSWLGEHGVCVDVFAKEPDTDLMRLAIEKGCCVNDF